MVSNCILNIKIVCIYEINYFSYFIFHNLIFLILHTHFWWDNKPYTVILLYPWFCLPQFQLPMVNCSLGADDHPSHKLSESQQKPNAASQYLHYSPHFISSCRHLVISRHHKKKSKYLTIRYSERQTTFTNFYFFYRIVL